MAIVCRTWRSGPYATDAAGTVHVPAVTQEQGGHRAVCPCGDRGPWRSARKDASADLADHLLEVSAVPETDRCRLPRRHRLRPWERCALCTGQTDLFDLIEEVS